MKKTKTGLLQGTGRRLLAAVCAGILAGAMAAMPALAVTHPAVFPEEGIDDSLTYKLCLRYKDSSGFPECPLEVYKVADLVAVDGGEAVYDYQYVDGGEYGDLTATDLVETLAQNESEDTSSAKYEQYQKYVDYYNENYGNLEEVTLKDDSGADVADPVLNATYTIGKGLDACGLYFIRQKDGEYFLYGKTHYTVGSVLISVPNYSAHQAETDSSVYTITVNPKPVKLSTYTPGGGGGGGGGGGNRRYVPSTTPPSEGSVLGASRDPDTEIPPQVLGANRLPQTGQLWWPVPVLCIAGMGLVASGIYRRKTAVVQSR